MPRDGGLIPVGFTRMWLPASIRLPSLSPSVTINIAGIVMERQGRACERDPASNNVAYFTLSNRLIETEI